MILGELLFGAKTYQHFDQVRLPNQQEVPEKNNPHAMLDMNRFMADELANFVNMQADILRRYIKREQWITTNLIRFLIRLILYG